MRACRVAKHYAPLQQPTARETLTMRPPEVVLNKHKRCRRHRQETDKPDDDIKAVKARLLADALGKAQALAELARPHSARPADFKGAQLTLEEQRDYLQLLCTHKGNSGRGGADTRPQHMQADGVGEWATTMHMEPTPAKQQGLNT